MSKKTAAVRGIRKSAHISRKIFTKAANLSGRVEKKADRIIHGTDPTMRIHDSVLLEKVYYEALEEIIPIHPALPRAGRQANTTLFIPSLQRSSFFGGTATALILAASVAKKHNSTLRIVETLRHGKAHTDDLSKFLNSAGTSIAAEKIELIDLSGRRYNNYGYLDIHPEDTFIASAWWDAYMLDMLPLLKPYVYLIQDYEPIFYNNSDKRVLAESTYQSTKFIPLLNTKFMYNYMVSEGYEHIKENGMWFEPAVNMGAAYGYNEGSKKDKKRLFFYGRETVSRNLFFGGLKTLSSLFSKQQLHSDEWELFMAGQDGIPDIILESGDRIQSLGKMTLDEYHNFLKTVDVAITPMMAPHPNYPTLEFASCGAAVVTTSYKTKQDLSNYSKNIILTSAEPTQYEAAILRAASMSPEERLTNAKASNIPTTWKDSFALIMKKL